MRKRRRLANKMTIMVCAVLIAVSAFFYAPMEVNAEEVLSSSGFQSFGAGSINNRYTNALDGNFGVVDLYSDAVEGSFYEVKLNVRVDVISNNNTYWSSIVLSYGSVPLFSAGGADVFAYSTSHYVEREIVVYLSSEQIENNAFSLTSRYIVEESITTFDYTLTLTYDVLSVIELSESAEQSYNSGYNAGYSDGEQAGYGNGYSNGFADGEASVDTDAIYDEAFQAGIDSVDTQSYYDAGYQAGYQVAYSEGYESGYDVGYQSAMDRIATWGADTSDYPLELNSGDTNGYFSVSVGSDIPFNYRDSDHWFGSNEYNPNHTYKYVINFSNIDEGLDSDILYDYWDIYLNIGGIEYNITPFKDMSVSVFIPGDRISTSYSFDWVLYNCANYVADDSNLAYLYVDYDFVIYDMGPSGDTQNHIANQTDQLTNGYDTSSGDSANSSLSTGLNEFETAENSLFATATTGMKDFTFFDFESVPAMLTAVTFITSIMGSWFEQAGGASGVGIVLSILFSVMLVSMVLGLYRLYQSAGHRAEARERHRESMERWKKGK